MTEEHLRLPPQAIEAEMSILGSMMIDPESIDIVNNWLEISDFYRQDHQKIFEVIQMIDSSNDAVDVITVSDKLTELGDIEQCGGLTYLGRLAKETPNSGNVKSYAKIVRERAKLRKVIDQSNETIQACYQPDSRTPEQIIHELSVAMDGIDKNSDQSNESGMRELLSAALDEIEAQHKSKKKILGYSTGLTDLDARIGGLQKRKLIIVAGRPSMGKSCFSTSICDQALIDGAKVKVFSMEMDRTEIAKRNLSRWSVVDFGRIMNASQLQTDDWPRMTSALGEWNSRNLSIDDTSNLNINQIRARCRQAKRKDGLDIVVIDYLQLMQLRPGISKTDAIGEITRALKVMSGELDISIIALSQLNRSLENRPNKRPIMSDLRASGDIEQDADQILFLYRDEVYSPDTNQKGLCEVDVSKYRNGKTGMVKTVFEGHHQRFLSYSQVAQMQDYQK